MQTVFQVVFYALFAAASALALTSTLVVLKSGRARLNGVIFALAFLLGESLAWVLALALGFAVPGGDGKRAAAILKLVVGLLLFAAAGRIQRGAALPSGPRSERTQRLLERLGRLTPAMTFWAGGLLGIGGPKRLTITLVAAATVSVSGLSDGQKSSLALLYVLVAGLLVWVPVSIYVVAGKRATEWFAAAQAWLMARQRPLSIYSLLVIGSVMVADALVELV